VNGGGGGGSVSFFRGGPLVLFFFGYFYAGLIKNWVVGFGCPNLRFFLWFTPPPPPPLILFWIRRMFSFTDNVDVESAVNPVRDELSLALHTNPLHTLYVRVCSSFTLHTFPFTDDADVESAVNPVRDEPGPSSFTLHIAAPSPRASLGRRTVCGRTEQRPAGFEALRN